MSHTENRHIHSATGTVLLFIDRWDCLLRNIEDSIAVFKMEHIILLSIPTALGCLGAECRVRTRTPGRDQCTYSVHVLSSIPIDS